MPEPASSKPRIAIIGLGSMGYGMATSLRRAGFEVTGCDVSADAVAAGDLEPGAPQRGRHAIPHRTEPDDGNAWF